MEAREGISHRAIWSRDTCFEAIDQTSQSLYWCLHTSLQNQKVREGGPIRVFLHCQHWLPYTMVEGFDAPQSVISMSRNCPAAIFAFENVQHSLSTVVAFSFRFCFRNTTFQKTEAAGEEIRYVRHL